MCMCVCMSVDHIADRFQHLCYILIHIVYFVASGDLPILPIILHWLRQKLLYSAPLAEPQTNDSAAEMGNLRTEPVIGRLDIGLQCSPNPNSANTTPRIFTQKHVVTSCHIGSSHVLMSMMQKHTKTCTHTHTTESATSPSQIVSTKLISRQIPTNR